VSKRSFSTLGHFAWRKGRPLAAATPPRPELDGHQATLPARMGDRLRRDHALQPLGGHDHPLPLPRRAHPQPLEPHRRHQPATRGEPDAL